MRPAFLVLEALLALATDLAYRDIWDFGPASLDLPLVFILWVAIQGSRPELHLVVLVVACARSTFGLDGWLASWLPLALGGEVMFLVRERVILRWLSRRIAAAGLVSTFALWAGAQFLSSTRLDESLVDAALGGLVASLCASLLFPILDATQPLSRQHRAAG